MPTSSSGSGCELRAFQKLAPAPRFWPGLRLRSRPTMIITLNVEVCATTEVFTAVHMRWRGWFK